MFCTLLIKNFCSIKSKLRLIMNNQKGVTAVIVAIVAAVLIAFAALAIDVGYMYVTRNELQNVADAAALAGCGKLGRIYLDMTAAEQKNYELVSDDKAAIETAANNVAKENKAADVYNIAIDDSDIVIGTWDWNQPDPSAALIETTTQPDAVRVTARRDETINGAVATFFARILSIFGGSHDTFTVSAVATAALSGLSIADLRGLVPFGISEKYFDPGSSFWPWDSDTPPSDSEPVELILDFSPTGTSGAGWHIYNDDVASISKLRDKMIDLIYSDTMPDNDDNNFPDPPDNIRNGENWLDKYFAGSGNEDAILNAGIGDSFNFIGTEGAALFNGKHLEWTGDNNDEDGTISGTGQIAAFPALFDYYRMRDGDGENSQWTTYAPVYNDDVNSPNNPHGYTPIVAFAEIVITGYNPSDNTVTLTIDFNKRIEFGRGEGGSSNIMGSIPNLVQ